MNKEKKIQAFGKYSSWRRELIKKNKRNRLVRRMEHLVGDGFCGNTRSG